MNQICSISYITHHLEFGIFRHLHKKLTNNDNTPYLRKKYNFFLFIFGHLFDFGKKYFSLCFLDLNSPGDKINNLLHSN